MHGIERARPLATVWRGARKRCGRCGSSGIFDGYFRLRTRCPVCGYRFAREEGFFTGVYLVNLGITEVVLWVALMAFVVWRAGSGDGVAVWPVVAAGSVCAVLLPVAFYPHAVGIWAAFDLVTRPLEPDEEAEAVAWVAATTAAAPRPGTDGGHG